MVKKLTYAAFIVFSLASCSSIRPLTNSANKPVPVSESNDLSRGPNANVRFLDDITMDAASSTVKVQTETSAHNRRSGAASVKEGSNKTTSLNAYYDRPAAVEKMSAVQLKYAILLNTEVEELKDMNLLMYVDDWYGTPYRMGGTTRGGIDCSAFTQAIYLSAFGVSLPRTAREQYKNARIISTTELKQGDLVFFNTRGGVSHVGIYLTNNKFIHASTSQGVTVSDLFDPYYLKRFLGSGRIEKPEAGALAGK